MSCETSISRGCTGGRGLCTRPTRPSNLGSGVLGRPLHGPRDRDAPGRSRCTSDRRRKVDRISADAAAAVLLIAVPIAFNLAFFELGRAFGYPNILRREPDEILRRFAVGGSGLVLRWEALAGQRTRDGAAGGVARDRPRRAAGAHGALDRHRRGRGTRPGARARALAVRRTRSSRAATSPPRAPTPRPPDAQSSSRSRPSTACSAWASASTWATCSRGCGPCWWQLDPLDRRAPGLAGYPRPGDWRRPAHRRPRVRGPQREGRLAAGGHDRADRLHHRLRRSGSSHRACCWSSEGRGAPCWPPDYSRNCNDPHDAR